MKNVDLKILGNIQNTFNLYNMAAVLKRFLILQDYNLS